MDWSEHYSQAKQRKYWVHKRSGDKTWVDPSKHVGESHDDGSDNSTSLAFEKAKNYMQKKEGINYDTIKGGGGRRDPNRDEDGIESVCHHSTSSSSGYGSSSPDWFCECGFQNFARRNECFKCAQPKDIACVGYVGDADYNVSGGGGGGRSRGVAQHASSLRHSDASLVLDLFPDIAGDQELDREGKADFSDSAHIILDAANIGWCHGQNSQFSIDGVIKALGYFENLSLEHQTRFAVTAFLPSSYFRKKPKDGSKGNAKMPTEDIDKIQALVDTGKLTVVPAGDHDDRYLLNYTLKVNGFIVSNDLFNDHIVDDTGGDSNNSVNGFGDTSVIYKSWLQRHRVGFTFLRHDTFMINLDFERFFLDKLRGISGGNSGIDGMQNHNFDDTSENGIMTMAESHSGLAIGMNSVEIDQAHPVLALEATSQPLNLDLEPYDLRMQIYSNVPHILAISNAISATFTSEKANELKYLLMARAHALIDIENYALAYNDLEFILTKLDTEMSDAIKLIHIVNSHRQ